MSRFFSPRWGKVNARRIGNRCGLLVSGRARPDSGRPPVSVALPLRVRCDAPGAPVNSWHFFPRSRGLPERRGEDQNGSGPTCQHEQMVPRLPLLDDVLPPLVRALVHALHDVFDLLQLQPPQVLVLVQGVCQQLLHTGQTGREDVSQGSKVIGTRPCLLVTGI